MTVELQPYSTTVTSPFPTPPAPPVPRRGLLKPTQGWVGGWGGAGGKGEGDGAGAHAPNSRAGGPAPPRRVPLTDGASARRRADRPRRGQTRRGTPPAGCQRRRSSGGRRGMAAVRTPVGSCQRGAGRRGRRGWELARVAADTSAHDAALPLGGWGGGARATAACPPARSQEAGLPTAVARPRAPELRQPDHVGARQGATEAQRVPQQPDLTRTVGDCSGRRGSAAGTPRRPRGQIRERCPRSSPPLPTGTGLVPGSRSRPSRRGGGGGPHWSHAPQVVWIYGHGARLLLASHAPRDLPSLPPVQESANG